MIFIYTSVLVNATVLTLLLKLCQNKKRSVTAFSWHCHDSCAFSP